MESELSKVAPIGDAPKHKSYLFWGPPATGKTTLATKHPGRKLFLDMDQKLAEMENLSPSAKESISVWQPNVSLTNEIMLLTVDASGKNVSANFDPKQPRPEGYDRLRHITNELLRKCEYDAVVLDTLTRTSQHIIALVMHEHKVTSMTEKLWGVVGTNLLNYLLGFLQLPCTRIIVAHEQHKKIYDRTREVVLEELIRPMVVGQMANYIHQHFSEVYYFLGRNLTSKTDSNYYIQTGSDRLKSARTTKNLLFEQPIDSEVIFGPSRA